MFIKIFLGVLLVGIGVAAAFGRDPKTGKTVEQYLYSLFNFYSRARYQQRGASAVEQRIPVKVVSETPKKSTSAPAPVTPPAQDSGNESSFAAGLRFPPLPLGGGLFMSIISIAFLAALMVWVWGGGVNELRTMFQVW